jgi:membrane-bound serine protease (ClpP class)
MTKRVFLLSFRVLLLALLAAAVLPLTAGPAAALSASAPAAPAQAGGTVLALTFDGPLTPAQAAYLDRGLIQAERMGAELVILRLNTPGGQIDLMDRMIARIRNGSVPVVVYVAPRNATAGSAGAVLTLAGHASAMAPDTVIGAASPVGGGGEDIDATLEAKVKEILRAQVRSLAAHRPPEAIALAEEMIETARAVTAAEAFDVGLVDFLAASDDDLLRQLDGFHVSLDGETRTLRTADLAVSDLSMSLIETVLNLLTNPNIVVLLLFIGAQSILIELSNPGIGVAGVVGVTALALAFYGLGVLPVNWFGLLFIAMAFALFIMEINTPTYGGLTVAGIASLIVGALVLFNSPGSPDFFRVSVPLVVGTSVVIAGGTLALVTFALRTRRLPPSTGAESLVGRVGEMRSATSVQVAGELWSVEPPEDEAVKLEAGQRVVVTGVSGLRLHVSPKGKAKSA